MAIEYTAATASAGASTRIVIFSPPFFAAVPRLPPAAAASAAPNWHRDPSGVANKGELAMAMPTIEARNAPAIDACVWRDLAQLAVEALAIGVVFSVLLALAVFVVARGARGDEYAASQTPTAEIRAPAPMA
jgi:hypothetical protein